MSDESERLAAMAAQASVDALTGGGEIDSELVALRQTIAALQVLDEKTQQRVLRYLVSRFAASSSDTSGETEGS